MRAVPYDYAAAEADAGWRERLHWPVSHAALTACLRAQLRTLLGLAGALGEGERTALLLCAHELMLGVRALTQAAFAVAAEPVAGLAFTGGPPELAYLRGTVATVPPPSDERSVAQRAPYRDRPLRRLVRAASWSPFARIPKAWLAPDALAVTHNPLLHAGARESSLAVGFHHADSLLVQARARAPGAAPPAGRFDGLARRVGLALAADAGLDDRIAERLARLIEARFRERLPTAHADLACLAAVACLHENLWSATGGYYPARALGLEVLRRGGAVTRFDHGGGSGLIDAAELTGLMEYAVASRVVVASAEQVAAHRAHNPGRHLCGLPGAEAVAGVGDPTFDLSPGSRRPPARGGRPRVLYASTVLLGFRQVFPPLLHDLVYLDWQLRLAHMLADLPIALTCKPHPEGMLHGRPHPLAAVARCSSRSFEDALAEADIVVWDYGSSTAFWQTLATALPVVLVDLGNCPRTALGERMVAARCRVLRPSFDARGRPLLERQALRDAVLDTPAPADPEPFRRFLLGRA